MLFPVSGVSVNPLVPFAVGFLVSFFTSMAGVSGAFLLLPFQVSFLGYTAPSVSATNQVFNVVAIPSGVYRYLKEGRMLWPLTWAVVIGTLPGVFIGAWVRVVYLPDPQAFKLFAGLVMLYIGWRLLQDIVRRGRTGSGGRMTTVESSRLTVSASSFVRVAFDFGGESYSFSPAIIYAICFLVGIVGGVYGIGGGAIIAPFFVAVVGLPVYTVAGASLMGTLVTSVAGVVFYHVLAHFHPGHSVAPDWMLGMLFGAGGMFGMYMGARTQKYVPAKIIKGMLTLVILSVAGKYILDFF
ncbi:MAG: sulfite exporter TauE/SafE family protein [Deltaproteobacteria bacterium]|nr:sulfite exporter TauE/SafE family protein [Deltaproteobacteria bacterium]